MQLLMAVGGSNNKQQQQQQKHYHRQNNNNLNSANNSSGSNKRPLQKSFTYQPSQQHNAYYINNQHNDNHHQYQQNYPNNCHQSFKQQQSYLNEDYLMGRNGRRVPIGEPVLFLYHDDDLSSSSAPDSFHSMTTTSSHGQQQQLQFEQAFQQSAGTANGHHLTIEELRLAINSCWLCGCNWQQDHVSLDCQECGGYALTRPCPNCDGRCKEVWKRNINGSHDYHKARWIGQCLFDKQQADCCASAATASSAAGVTVAVAGTANQSIIAEASLFRNLDLRSDDDDDQNDYDDDDEEEEYEDDDDCGIQVIPVPTICSSTSAAPAVADICDFGVSTTTFALNPTTLVGGDCDNNSGNNNKSHDEQQQQKTI